jgi:two-component system, sporulation sensor kinase E
MSQNYFTTKREYTVGIVGKKHSVVQSTMIKITVLVFCILLIFYFFTAKIYWDKAVLKREFKLLTVASTVEMRIQANYQNILDIKENPKANNNEKIDLLNSLLQNSLDFIAKENPEITIGYYDKDFKDIVFYASSNSESLGSSIILQEVSRELDCSSTPQFISDAQVVNWDGKGVVAVAVPVFYQDQIVGHTWAMVRSAQIFYNSYFEYSKILVPSLILAILVLLLLKKCIVKIERSLDNFTQTVLEDRPVNKDDLDFPELIPVYERILVYLDNVRLLNDRLVESNEKLLTIMEGISDGFFSLDRQWKFTFVNKETKKMIKKENIDLVGKDASKELSEILNPLTISNLRYAMTAKIPMHWEASSLTGDRYYEAHAYPFAQGLTVFFRDITLRKQRENEFVRLERLNLIGQMAAGISHEVRNPLTIVRGFLQMLENKADSEQNKEYMEIMISEIDRANGIITDFLSLAKVNSESNKLENINGIIIRIYPMLQADAFNSNKDIIINLEDIPDLKVNDSEIRQLVLNLVRNGLEETQEGGKVFISTYLEDNNVVLAIKDEGKGIPAEIQEKMGTPFITTKEKGTGLGLAISIGIAHRHKARFEFETGLLGTTFYIIFQLEQNILI